jgi:hypothetical protein
MKKRIVRSKTNNKLNKLKGLEAKSQSVNLYKL